MTLDEAISEVQEAIDYASPLSDLPAQAWSIVKTALVEAQNTPTNTDYAAALRVYAEYSGEPTCGARFIDWLGIKMQRLNTVE